MPILTNAVNATIVEDTGIGTIQNDDELPPEIPALSINDTSVIEGTSSFIPIPGVFEFTVSLSAPSSQTVTVSFYPDDGTAVYGDYYFDSAIAELTFLPGETSQSIIVLISQDSVAEENETFFIILESPVNAAIADGEGVGTILNDD